MNEVLNYLKECGTFYLATCECGQPKLRPFGAVAEFEGKLYIITNNKKEVFKQMLKNPKIALCGMINDTWLRVEGEIRHDIRRDAKVKMLETNPSLRSMYNEDDNLMEVLYLVNATATISSFSSEPKVMNF